MESQVFDLVQAGIAVDLLVGYDVHSEMQCGIRLRTYGKALPPDRMIIAGGETFEEALNNAVQKARSARWERLEWAARPWPLKVVSDRAAGYGFGAPL